MRTRKRRELPETDAEKPKARDLEEHCLDERARQIERTLDALRVHRDRRSQELRYWTSRQTTAQLAQLPTGDTVQFGSTVTFKRSDGRTQTFKIVGTDEADPVRGTLSYISPAAQALLGRSVGEEVQIGATRAEIIALN